MKKSLFFLFLIFLVLSCNNEENEAVKSSSLESQYQKDSNFELKREFGQALAKLLLENQDLRKLIKTEALKKIDYDYDVLYGLIKNKMLSNNVTFESLLLKYIDAPKLKQIEDQIPTLTIFVPELPEDSFSAELWNVDADVPIVAIRTCATNDILMIESNGDEWLLESQYIPGYPVVVIKENERIIPTDHNTLKNINSSQELHPVGTNSYLSFVDNIFDNINNPETDDLNLKSTGRRPGSRGGDSGGSSSPNDNSLPKEITKVIDAYDIFLNTNNWHRDYIYYNLTANQTRGRVNKNVMEYIVGFEFYNPDGSQDAQRIINKIADQTGDPMPTGNIRTNSGWTEGEFEFLVKVQVASTTGIGTELKKYMRLSPNQLFRPETIFPATGNAGRSRPAYTGKYLLNEHIRVNIPLIEWNLETISPSIKISIEEVDFVESTKNTTTTSTEFASNFEYSSTSGDTEKVGLKFGSSKKRTMSVAYEHTVTKGNDELGDVVVNFGDDIIKTRNYSCDYYNGDYWLDYNSKYESGYYRLYITPKITH